MTKTTKGMKVDIDSEFAEKITVAYLQTLYIEYNELLIKTIKHFEKTSDIFEQIEDIIACRNAVQKLLRELLTDEEFASFMNGMVTK